ncbi:exonuclease domain-containing protein [Vibrio celticus]|uniref:exonuclease domain-containing protein n=1 Tax=Vibrio celticus TaxID=446372 RepID=UPI0040685D66
MFNKWLSKWLKKPTAKSIEEIHRQRLENDICSKPLKEYLETPLITLDQRLIDIEFVSLDFETTGLNYEKDKLLSIGLTHFSVNGIELASCEEVYISHGEYVRAESAEVNEITPKHLHEGLDLDCAMDWLFERIKGKVVVAHCASIERQFIQAYLVSKYNLKDFPCYFIDTIKIERHFSYEGKRNFHSSYQLNDLRRHHKLPAYYAHSAASDALACAELFLLQIKKFGLIDNTFKALHLKSN